MRRIGVLMNMGSDDAEGQPRNAAFLQGLQELGWTVGRNVRIEYRWSAGDAELVRRHALELVALAPDVILASGGAVVPSLLQATRCRMHGGKSPGAPNGNRNAFKHGLYTAEAIARRREISALIRAMNALAASG
jgi:hypothetical protein